MRFVSQVVEKVTLCVLFTPQSQYCSHPKVNNHVLVGGGGGRRRRRKRKTWTWKAQNVLPRCTLKIKIISLFSLFLLLFMSLIALLALFMGPTILFQLFFIFIYSTFSKISGIQTHLQCAFGQRLKIKIISLFSLYLLLFMSLTTLFDTIHKHYYTISTNLYLYLHYFQ